MSGGAGFEPALGNIGRYSQRRQIRFQQGDNLRRAQVRLRVTRCPALDRRACSKLDVQEEGVVLRIGQVQGTHCPVKARVSALGSKSQHRAQ